MPMSNNYGGMPPSSNSMWIGNNYSSMPRNSYPIGNQNNMATASFMNQQQPQTINNVLQVMGPESVQAYSVGPNSNVIFMDSKRDVFYTKKTDDAGYAETKAFAFHEIPLFEPAQTAQIQMTDMPQMNQNYVTKSDFDEFKKVIEDLVMHNE